MKVPEKVDRLAMLPIQLHLVENSFRIKGGYGSSKEYEIERLKREVELMLTGEGISDAQKMIIGGSLLEDYALKQ